VGCRNPVSCRDAVSGGRECPPLTREDATEKPETTRSERTQDERLAFLQREPCRIRHDDPMCDQDLERAGHRSCPEESPGGSYLRPPACIVRCGDGIQEGRRHRRATKGKTRGLAGAAEGTGQNRRHAQIETAYAPPNRAGICTALLGEVSLRGAIGQIDGVFVRLREVRGRMSENEYKTAPLKRACQCRLGRGICACLGPKAAATARTAIATARARKLARRWSAALTSDTSERQSDPSRATRAHASSRVSRVSGGAEVLRRRALEGKDVSHRPGRTRALAPQLASHLRIEERELVAGELG
jgi:hypothetical protein